MQILVLIVIPDLVTTCNDDNNDNKPDHLIILIAFRKYIIYIFETIVKCLLVPVMKNKDNDNNDDNEKEIKEMEEEEL